MSICTSAIDLAYVEPRKMLQSEGEALATLMMDFLDKLRRAKNDDDRLYLVKRYCVDVNDLQAVKEYLLMALLSHDATYRESEDDEGDALAVLWSKIEPITDNLRFLNRCLYELKIFSDKSECEEKEKEKA